MALAAGAASAFLLAGGRTLAYACIKGGWDERTASSRHRHGDARTRRHERTGKEKLPPPLWSLRPRFPRGVLPRCCCVHAAQTIGRLRQSTRASDVWRVSWHRQPPPRRPGTKSQRCRGLCRWVSSVVSWSRKTRSVLRRSAFQVALRPRSRQMGSLPVVRLGLVVACFG